MTVTVTDLLHSYTNTPASCGSVVIRYQYTTLEGLAHYRCHRILQRHSGLLDLVLDWCQGSLQQVRNIFFLPCTTIVDGVE